MKSNLVLATILACAIVVLVRETNGLKCYQCSGCEDPFNSTNVPIVDCTGYCIKVQSSLETDRSCIPEKMNYTCRTEKMNDITVEGCACNSDLCNGGSVERLSVMLSVTIFVVMILKAMVW